MHSFPQKVKKLSTEYLHQRKYEVKFCFNNCVPFLRKNSRIDNVFA